MSVPFRSRCSSCLFRLMYRRRVYRTAGAYKEENDFVPVNKVLSMTPAEFFNTANALMQVNPPADADEELLKKLSAINVGAGKTFDAALLGEGAAERWTQMLQGLRTTLAADGAKYAQKLGQWIYYGKPIGDFGTEYTYRAMVALVGLLAPTPWTWQSIPRQRWMRPAQR